MTTNPIAEVKQRLEASCDIASTSVMLLRKDGALVVDLAECGVCGLNKPVCCDEGYTEDQETGRVAHIGAVCRECCAPHHSPRPSSQLERMDCDQ